MKKMAIVVLSIIALTCEEPETYNREDVPYQSVEMECLIGPSLGGTIEARIDSQQEYDSLFNYLVTEPQEAFISANYDQLIEDVQRNYPTAIESEYDSILRNDHVYTRFPWVEKGCEPPSINFSKYTLLGIRTIVGGCTFPNDSNTSIETFRNNKEKTFTFNIVTDLGTCEMAVPLNEWILVEKLPEDYVVEFHVDENMEQ